MEYENIISSWLKSMDLHCYLDSFMDNGYDELEVCKQIGEDDLDAIGVFHPHHRELILKQVKVLQQKGGTHVYFILDPKYTRQQDVFISNGYPVAVTSGTAEGVRQEEVGFGKKSRCFMSNNNNQIVNYPRNVSPPLYMNDICPRSVGIRTGCGSIKPRFTAYSSVQLRSLILDKMTDDCITLSSWLDPGMSDNDTFLQHLSSRYAKELNCPYHVVYQTLLELLKQHQTDINHRISSQQQQTCTIAPCRSISLGTMTLNSSNKPCRKSTYKSSTTSSSFSESTESEISNQESPPHTSMSPLLPEGPQHYLPLQSNKVTHTFELEEDKPKMSTLGRILRNISGRKKKPRHNIQYIDDLCANQISMPADDRINLMILVKEGKLTTDQALERVKQYEKQTQLSIEGSTSTNTPAMSTFKSTYRGRPMSMCEPIRTSILDTPPMTNCGVTNIYTPSKPLTVPKPCNIWRLS